MLSHRDSIAGVVKRANKHLAEAGVRIRILDSEFRVEAVSKSIVKKATQKRPKADPESKR